MVKFSKELEAQLIPEWKDAFVNYWKLKKNVKKIKLSRTATSHTDRNSDFSPLGFARRIISSTFRGQDQEKREIIKVGRVQELVHVICSWFSFLEYSFWLLLYKAYIKISAGYVAGIKRGSLWLAFVN